MVWEKGVSGNPLGRSKTLDYIKKIAQEHCPKAIETLAKNLDSTDERVQVAAAQVLLDRGYGKAQQILEIKKPDPFDDMSIDDVIALRERLNISRGMRPVVTITGPRTEIQETGNLQTIQETT